jgi:hypothetical protein
MSDQQALDAIQQRMREVRGALGEEMVDLVSSTRDMTDWRKYVRANPWLCLAAAAAVGYFVVPRRPPATGMTEKQWKAVLREAPSITPQSKTSRLKGELLSFVSHAAVRAFMGYLGNRMAATSMMSATDEPTPVRRTPK